MLIITTKGKKAVHNTHGVSGQPNALRESYTRIMIENRYREVSILPAPAFCSTIFLTFCTGSNV